MYDSGKQRIKDIQQDLQLSHNVMERNVIGWSICLYFLEEVRIVLYFFGDLCAFVLLQFSDQLLCYKSIIMGCALWL